MVNKVILFINRLPKLFVGFVVIVVALFFIVQNDPPTTICEVQMDVVRKQLKNGFFVDRSGGLWGQSAKAAKQFCLETNSPGGCYDMFKRMTHFEKVVRTVPEECGQSESTAVIKSVMAKSIRLFAEIGWGDAPPVNQYDTVSWLESQDLGLFCRLKFQFIRLYGKGGWKAYAGSVLPTLPGAEALTQKERYKRSLFSYKCKGLY